jgi:division protein CdvB (Snf7/Vps24/ESCRT-III family)
MLEQGLYEGRTRHAQTAKDIENMQKLLDRIITRFDNLENRVLSLEKSNYQKHER